MFQGGIADWIDRARAQGWHEDVSSSAPPGELEMWVAQGEACRRRRPSLFEGSRDVARPLGGWVSELDVVSGVLSAEQLERAAQQDMDSFLLDRRLRTWGACRKAQGGACLLEGQAGAEEGAAAAASWSGRRLTAGLAEEDWRSRGSMRVAAVVCVYDDSSFLHDIVTDLVAQLDHVVVLVSSLPWNGDVRGDNRHTMRVLADLLARPDLTRDRLSVVKGRWATEGQQRQVSKQASKQAVGQAPSRLGPAVHVTGALLWPWGRAVRQHAGVVSARELHARHGGGRRRVLAPRGAAGADSYMQTGTLHTPPLP